MGDLCEITSTPEPETDLQFVQRVLEEYPWEADVKRQLTHSFDQLNSKYRDRKLNVSVVGEFSTGKSTFINALLRTELLAAASLQGTTVSSTVLEFGKEYTIAVIRRDGKRQIMRLQNVEQTRQALSRIVSYNEDAQSIHTVSVTLPVPALQNTGLRIVDTPGTDATELWHEEVTVRAIEELSDLSIILVNGTKPLPESFCAFIEENLRRVLERCVFVVTKLDLVAPKERGRMLEYISMKLRNTFGIEKPIVLPFFSAEIIGTFAENEFAHGNRDMVDLSQRTEKFIRRHSSEWRRRIQSQRKEILFDQMYSALADQMTLLSQDLHRRLELLEKSRSVDLEAFMKEQKIEKVNALYTGANEQREEMRQKMEEHAGHFINSMVARVNQFQRADHLEYFLRAEMVQVCSKAAQYQDKIAMLHCGRVGNLRYEKMRQFREDFQKLYAGLNVLNVQMPYAPRGNPAPVPIPSLGGFSGMMLFGNGLEMVKHGVIQRMNVALRQYFGQLQNGFVQSYDNFLKSNHQLLLQEMHQYRVAYRGEVDKRIEQEEATKHELETRIAALEQDQQSLMQRQAALEKQGVTVA